jgi:hypothetical protein
VAAIQANALPNPTASANAPSAATGPACSRKPSSVPTATVTRVAAAVRAPSARIRPVSTAERAIGRERNRSMMPLARSSLRPIPVMTVPNTTVCTMIPGMTNCT